MRSAIIFAFCLTVSLLGVATMSHQLKQQQREADRIRFQRDPSKLRQFIATLKPEVMLECVQHHDAGKEIDMDYLQQCGDFDLYADYLKTAKLEAVIKFRDVLVRSSSKLQFEHGLAN